MTTLYLQTAGSHARLERGRLVVETPSEDPDSIPTRQKVPLSQIDRVVWSEGAQLTSQAIGACLRRQIHFQLVDGVGDTLGALAPPPTAHGGSRLAQYQRALDDDWNLEFAKRLVAAKIHNAARLLRKVGDNHQDVPDKTLDQLRNAIQHVPSQTNLPSLRGVEGAAAAAYFDAWGAFIPEPFQFDRRAAHPPKDAVNACISYASAIVYRELTDRIHRKGLDPAIGHFHHTENGRWSLALDLMEPFRPILIEAHVLRLLALHILNPDDFEPHGDGVWIARSGKSPFIEQFEKRLQREFYSEHRAHRTTLATQLDAIVEEYHVALHDLDSFNPFRAN